MFSWYRFQIFFIIIIIIALRFDPWIWRPYFLPQITHVFPMHARVSYWGIWRYSSALRLSIYTSAFQWAFFLRKFFQYSFRDSFCRISLLPAQLTLISYHAGTLWSTKSRGLKFPKSRTESHVTYSCNRNSSRFTFLTFVHSWRVSFFHSLKPRRLYINQKTQILSRILKLKHVLKFIRFPTRVAC